MNYEGLCRTAPATPGLSIKEVNQHAKEKKHHKKKKAAKHKSLYQNWSDWTVSHPYNRGVLISTKNGSCNLEEQPHFIAV